MTTRALAAAVSPYRIRSEYQQVIRGVRMPAEDVIERDGMLLTTAVRALIDIGRFIAGDDAVVGMDQCLRADETGRSATTRAQVLTYLDTHPHLHRSRRVRASLTEADGGAESPPETHTRLLLHRDGLTMFTPQIVIDRGSPSPAPICCGRCGRR